MNWTIKPLQYESLIEDSSGKAIALVYGRPESSISTARIIASAPEMLHMLELFLGNVFSESDVKRAEELVRLTRGDSYE